MNICPLSTLRQLKFDLGKQEKDQNNVRDLDGVKRDTLGVVNIIIQLVPTEFRTHFQVLDIELATTFF